MASVMTMEINIAKEMFEHLYSGILGYQISHGQRKRDNLEDRSLVYGEVLPDSFYKVVAQASPPSGGVFCDLGSGSGKALFLAAMLFDFSRLFGVEVLTDLVTASRQVLARYDEQVRPALPPHRQQHTIDLLEGDLLECDLSGVDMVFTHSTCFEPPLLKGIGRKLGELKAGARVIWVGRQIYSEHLTVCWRGAMTLDWGTTIATIYERSS